MKKLESLTDFYGNNLNKEMMSKIVGGYMAPVGEYTGAGTICVSTSVSASGCCAYSEDYVGETGTLSYVPKNGTQANSDVDNPC